MELYEKALAIYLKVHEMAQQPNSAEASRLTVLHHASAIKGFLKSGKLDLAVQQMVTMSNCGMVVPTKAITELFNAASRSGPGSVQRVLDGLGDSVKLPGDAVTLHLSDCLERNDLGWHAGLTIWHVIGTPACTTASTSPC